MNANRYTLVLAEHHGGKLDAATYSVITAAHQIGRPVRMLLVAPDATLPSLEKQCAEIVGVDKVLSAAAPEYDSWATVDFASQILPLAENLAAVAMSNSYSGKRIIPYLAGKLGVEVSNDVSGIDGDRFLRPAYAGSLLIVERLDGAPKMISVRANEFAPSGLTAQPAPVERIASLASIAGRVEIVKHIAPDVHARLDLAKAKIVIGVGAGLKKEDWPMIERLADKLGAAIGASRAAVEAGLAASGMMLGQTGKNISPDLYIAVCISGAVQHMAGVKDSRVIVAINRDPDAPIFHSADYGIVGDAREIVPEMIREL